MRSAERLNSRSVASCSGKRGGQDLGAAYDFIGRFVAYPSEAARVAHTLWIAHTWFMDAWDSTPRAFPRPSQARAGVVPYRSPNPWCLVRCTPSTPPRPTRSGKFPTKPGRPRSSTTRSIPFSAQGGKGQRRRSRHASRWTPQRARLLAGAWLGGKVVETHELPGYCAVALTRSVKPNRFAGSWPAERHGRQGPFHCRRRRGCRTAWRIGTQTSGRRRSPLPIWRVESGQSGPV